MDLVYMPEVLSYGSLRAPVYRDYEQPWNRDYFNDGKNSCTTTRYQQEQYHHQMQKLKGEKKEHCYLCKESKRRTLGAYLRGKSRTTSCSEIHEEKEEENDDDDDEVHEQQKDKQQNKEIHKNDNKDNIIKEKNTKTDKININ